MQCLAPPLAGLPSSSCCVVKCIHNTGFNLIFTIYSTVACRTTLREPEIEESIYCPKPGKYLMGWSTVYLAWLQVQKVSPTAGPRDLVLSSTFLSMLDMREKDDFMSQNTLCVKQLFAASTVSGDRPCLHGGIALFSSSCLVAGFLREVHAQLVLLGLRASSLLYCAHISLS